MNSDSTSNAQFLGFSSQVPMTPEQQAFLQQEQQAFVEFQQNFQSQQQNPPQLPIPQQQIRSHEYQVSFTKLDIAFVDVGMFDGFDHGLQTDVQHMVALLTFEAEYMTLTRKLKEDTWLKGLSIESGFEISLLAGIFIGALMKAVPGLRYEHVALTSTCHWLTAATVRKLA
ncbi:hypothetical protein Tco_0793167 [Tanacetum coccineum]